MLFFITALLLFALPEHVPKLRDLVKQPVLAGRYTFCSSKAAGYAAGDRARQASAERKDSLANGGACASTRKDAKERWRCTTDYAAEAGAQGRRRALFLAAAGKRIESREGIVV
jgi:hypothetical protein